MPAVSSVNASILAPPSIPFADDRDEIHRLFYVDESERVKELMASYPLSKTATEKVQLKAQAYVKAARLRERERGLLDTFLQEFGLSNQEGVALMCLSEALLRVPDAETADRLIAEKLQSGNWRAHLGQSESLFVNAATWGLMLTGKLLRLDSRITDQTSSWMNGLVSRLGEPAVRKAIHQSMRIMGGEFVLGRTIEEAVKRDAVLAKKASRVPLCSFDMLGEGARTDADAQQYFQTYAEALKVVGTAAESSEREQPYLCHGVSVKLSALHARYEDTHRDTMMPLLMDRVRSLALMAKRANIHLTIDAEEANRLQLSLDVVKALALDPELAGWDGLGMALQCYSKRATAVMDWLIELARSSQHRIMVRLVKGAYWDTEIKIAQEQSLPGYPVFTRKAATDLSYLCVAEQALRHRDLIFPQFATHNAHTIAAINLIADTLPHSEMANSHEFQRLHGMGDLLYSAVAEVDALPPVRTYAPVGNHKDLLAYLVRRLLENGANTSFVNRFMDNKVAVENLVEDPVALLEQESVLAHPGIPLPARLFGEERDNSAGLDLTDRVMRASLLNRLAAKSDYLWRDDRQPIANGQPKGSVRKVINPARHTDLVGCVQDTSEQQMELAMQSAVSAFPNWNALGGEARAQILMRAADLLEQNRDEIMTLLVREAGKSLNDAVAEVREAVDFCRYYGAQARREFGPARALPGPTGEDNLYSLQGRGVFLCISPWNFPLAIFTGQVVAALAAGNAVIAKPAEQTPLVALEMVRILKLSGVPDGVLHCLPGPGETLGAALTADPRIGGVAMTGSTATAKIIARTLAERPGGIIPFIAETGGQNALFVDSTALPEQVTDDVIRSAFHSAGQRCSALRVLYVQNDIADGLIDMIKGAMDQLNIGDPGQLHTDIGPVIDDQARSNLQAHCRKLTEQGKLLHRVELGADHQQGCFMAPHLFEIDSISELSEEQFGPILHVVRYASQDLDRHLAELRATGYGLTLGVHSRIESTAQAIFNATTAGNTYINRDIIGAVVGSQPFGGKGLSGTGPKAGGPLYLHRFACERVCTINRVATGGNAELLNLE